MKRLLHNMSMDLSPRCMSNQNSLMQMSHSIRKYHFIQDQAYAMGLMEGGMPETEAYCTAVWVRQDQERVNQVQAN